VQATHAMSVIESTGARAAPKARIGPLGYGFLTAAYLVMQLAQRVIPCHVTGCNLLTVDKQNKKQSMCRWKEDEPDGSSKSY
jgi:hypothetical protein